MTFLFSYGNISFIMASKGLQMEYSRAFIILIFGFCIGLNVHVLYNYFSCTDHVHSTIESILLSLGLIDDIEICPSISETFNAIVLNLLLFGIIPVFVRLAFQHWRNLLQKQTREKAYNKPFWIDGYITTNNLDGFNKPVTVAHINILHCGPLKTKVVYYNHYNEMLMIPVKYEDEETD